MLLGGGSSCQQCGCVKTDCFVGISPSVASQSFDNATFLASGLSIGASAISLKSVTIYNDGYDIPLTAKLGGGYTNAPVCQIFLNDTSDTSLPYGPRPLGYTTGTLATLTPPASFAGATWTFTHAGLSLSANTIYWVVMSAPGGQTAYWDENDYTDLITPAEECYNLSAYSTNAGASWTNNIPELKWLFDYST